MNLARQTHAAGASQLLFATFNQDNADVQDAPKTSDRSTHCTLLVGSKSGYKIFDLSNVNKLKRIYECTTIEDVCIVETAFSSSLVAIVSLRAPRNLRILNSLRATEICNFSYRNSILAVKMNQRRLVVCLEESLYVYSIPDQDMLHIIQETPPNPAGLCALSENNYLAFPGLTVGEVHIFDTFHFIGVCRILAHYSRLAALTFDPCGSKLATASEKGTVIRIFSIPEGQKLFEFRRGIRRCVDIYSLAFSVDGTFLCASSNTETVHIFKLQTEKGEPPEVPSTWAGYLGSWLSASTSYLPSPVADLFNQPRAFATVYLPVGGLRNICSLVTIQKIPRVLVGSSDGYLYIYNLDPQDGGVCTLMKQHRFGGIFS